MRLLLAFLLSLTSLGAFAASAEPVTYEAFGAKGDGVADDLPAIVAAHAYANAHGLPVKTKPDATYHLGRRALTAIIGTDTDWGTSKFIIDDRDVEDHRKSLFAVKSLLPPVTLTLPKLTRDQARVDVTPPVDCWVRVENDHRRRYIRRGLNQNNGSAQRDCFILRRDGTIEGAIDWDYDTITKVEAHPLDPQPLVLRGGIFTTTANQMKSPQGYNYWLRNIAITRSNTTVVGVTHHIVGEGEFGSPYNGFLAVQSCANVTLRDCVVTGHKTYETIGAARKPVSMGTYDLIANEVVNFTMVGVRMENINDPTRWGVIGTNFCKNILLENCVLSRMDTHQGVSGTYTLRGCTLGRIGINAIGRGTLLIEDCTLNGKTLVSLREDYGSTWEGTLVIRNCKWLPNAGDPIEPVLLKATNDGQHDFGYPCFMPREILIDGLTIDDRNHPPGYAGLWLFSAPSGKSQSQVQVPSSSSSPTKSESAKKSSPLSNQPSALKPPPFAYQPTTQVTIRALTIASGLKPRVSPDADFAAQVKVVESN